ncbi:MAG: hypothetical protein KA712_19330 [Myxococcales bacterium]|nr:hypothetical protein [Myxococcales bacterium]
MKSPHPSYFALDAFAQGTKNVPDLQEHVKDCARCQAHLSRVQTPPESLPGWLRTDSRLAAPVQVSRESLLFAFFSRRGPWRVAVPLALAAVGFVFLQPKMQSTREPYTGVKAATPAVWAYVKRGSATFLWDGVAPLAKGDRLRLKVDPLGLPYIAVFSQNPAGRWDELWFGRSESPGSRLLPSAWQVDGRPEPEHLIVVVSSAKIEANDVERLRTKPASAERWFHELTFKKIIGQP